MFLCCGDDPVGFSARARDRSRVRTGSPTQMFPRNTPAQSQTRAAGPAEPGPGVRVRPEPGDPGLLTEGTAELPVHGGR